MRLNAALAIFLVYNTSSDWPEVALQLPDGNARLLDALQCLYADEAVAIFSL